MSDAPTTAILPSDVLSFWYETCQPAQWFKKDSNFDQEVRDRFGTLIEQGLRGELDHWIENLEGCLALILVLDQFTRNVYRDTPRAFAGDTKALAISDLCRVRGYLDHPRPGWRHFMLLPMMHSEDLAVQKKSLPLFKEHTDESIYASAIRHHDVVELFGRYPHRNIILGRTSTKAELEFLKNPGSRF